MPATNVTYGANMITAFREEIYLLNTLNAKRNAIEVQIDFNYVCQHFILYVQMDQLSRNLEQTVFIKCSFIHIC